MCPTTRSISVTTARIARTSAQKFNSSFRRERSKPTNVLRTQRIGDGHIPLPSLLNSLSRPTKAGSRFSLKHKKIRTLSTKYATRTLSGGCGEESKVRAREQAPEASTDHAEATPELIFIHTCIVRYTSGMDAPPSVASVPSEDDDRSSPKPLLFALTARAK